MMPFSKFRANFIHRREKDNSYTSLMAAADMCHAYYLLAEDAKERRAADECLKELDKKIHTLSEKMK